MAFLAYGDKTVQLADGGELVIGRHRECGIQINDEKSSRRHARVFARDGAWWVEDLDSANGTRLNGRALITGAKQLADGDVVAIGQVQLRFRLAVEQAKPAPRPEDDADLIGRTLGGNRLDHFVGRGLTGPVFKAWSEARKRQVMVKVLDRRLTEDTEFGPRFQRELTVTAGIEHPAVVRIFQCAASDGVLWYSMELVEGDTLAQRMQERVQRRDAIAIAIDLGNAMRAYHEAGLVHGDIKPASVGFGAAASGKKDLLRLLDIGLVGLTNAEGRMLQSEGSTRQVFYLCPAQARGGQCNARSDLYSLGCILFHLLAGRPPFVGGSFEEVVAAHEQQPVPSVAEALGLPAKIDDVLSGMLHKDPFFRYDSVGFAIDELEQVRELMAQETA